MKTFFIFSQTDTTQIIISKPIAKLIVKDLIEYDGLKIEKSITDSILYEQVQKSIIKDTIINNQKQTIYNLNQQFDNLNKQYKIEQSNSQYYITQLNQQKQKTWIVGGSGLLLTILTILILK